jgi:hypothetical protein
MGMGIGMGRLGADRSGGSALELHQGMQAQAGQPLL